MHIPDHLRYAENHEWAKREDDGTVRVGISDYAQDALGDIVFVDLPEPGREVVVGDVFAEIESTKSVAEIYAPIAGTITAVNGILEDAPETINAEPYGAGWLIVIQPAEGAILEHLMDAGVYSEFSE